MKRRQTLFLNKNPYDLLMEMNHTLLTKKAKITVPREGHYDPDIVNACVLDCFMDSEKSNKRCLFYHMDCDQCLQDFLDEEN